jgi:hypothetical protein
MVLQNSRGSTSPRRDSAVAAPPFALVQASSTGLATLIRTLNPEHHAPSERRLRRAITSLSGAVPRLTSATPSPSEGAFPVHQSPPDLAIAIETETENPLTGAPVSQAMFPAASA